MASQASGPVTAKSIAKALGLARSTVTMALNHHPAIHPQTRQRVLDAAKRLGYTSNGIARAMVSGKTRVIALLIGYQVFEHVGLMLGGMIEEANKHQYLIKVFRHCHEDSFEAILNQCMEQRVAAVVCNAIHDERAVQASELLGHYKIPLIMMDEYRAELCNGWVATDDRRGAREAVDYLASLGHRRIGMLSGFSSRVSTSQFREKGYHDAIKSCKLDDDPSLVVYGGLEQPLEEKAVEKLLSLPNPPTAVFAVTDYAAAIVLRVARRMGFHVPRDLSVIGFADLYLAKLTDPALTTVAQPFEEMGRRAVTTALEAIECGDLTQWRQEVMLNDTLMVRDSTGSVQKRMSRLASAPAKSDDR